MKFINQNLNPDKLIDGVFPVLKAAKEDLDPSKVNATIGSLCDENNNFVTFNSFYDEYHNLDNKIFARYAESISGNPDFNEAVLKHVLEDKVKLYTSTIATSGGTGAVSLTIKNILNRDDIILLPNIGWSSYSLMAKEYGLNILNYDIYNLDDLIEKIKYISTKQSKLLVVINSPCHNPCGLSYTKDDFNKIISCLNNLNMPCVLLNDIAYIDYSNDLKHSRDYMDAFNYINDNVLVVVAFSISKTMTSYGLRCGSAIIISKTKKDNDEVYNTFEKTARATWSNINNSAMYNFANVINNHLDDYNHEKDKYIKLIKERADLFIKEADEVGLNYYPYQEGFFITLKTEDNKKRDLIHASLIQNHIYTVKVNLGIRIAICSIALNDLKGLAKRIKSLMAIVE